MFADYKNASVVVSGAGNGVGKELALGFARRGSDVAVIDIHGEEAQAAAAERRALGRRALAVEADVSVLEDCRRVCDTVMAEFGKVDVLVNNAGVTALSPVT